MIEALSSIFSFLVLIQVIFAIRFLFRYLSRIEKLELDDTAEKTSIIIPFKNEAERILPLLEAFNNQSIKDEFYEVIFVNDNSTDSTSSIIEKNLKIPYQILDNSGNGKKSAIDQGIQNAHHEYILTLDADVEFSPAYLATLLYLKKSDILVLPVLMTGKKWIQLLGRIEFEWLQLFTYASRKVQLCNGANLLFNKDLYLSVKKVRSDFEIPSGDDIFLLEAAKKIDANVQRINHQNLLVKTPAPESLKALEQQRQRWMNKMRSVQEDKLYAESLLLLALQVMVLLSIIFLFLLPSSWLLLIPIGIKLFTEIGIALVIEDKGFSAGRVIAIIFHQILYPFLLLKRMIKMYSKKKPIWR
ncbi:MAG: glycosyltransferase [Crocinitomicaceae bacterium]|nr:glycosyltransferase [Crocinitomicaceae bacterium]